MYSFFVDCTSFFEGRKLFFNVYVYNGSLIRTWFGREPCPDDCGSNLARKLKGDLEVYFQGEKVDFSRYKVDFETRLNFGSGLVTEAGKALDLSSGLDLGLTPSSSLNFSRNPTHIHTYHSSINFRKTASHVGLNLRSIEILNELRKTSYGKVVTYGGLAKKVKSSARAVGQVMKRNPVPVIVPCHRVVASRGIGGFNQGLAIKKRLLELEGISLLDF